MATNAPLAKPTLTSHLTVKDAVKAIEFYQKALGAEELFRFPGPDGRVMHAEMRIGDSTFLLNDEYPEMGSRAPVAVGGTSVTLSLYFDSLAKVDAAWKRAVDGGAKVVMPIENQFWGDRYGIVEDPSGHRWSFCAKNEELTPEEIAKRTPR